MTLTYSLVAAALIALVLTLVPKISKPGKLVTTIFHEMGHATASLLTGGGASGIRIRWDTSGDAGTTHRVGAGGSLSRILTLLAGYATPINLGAILVGLAFTPWSVVGLSIIGIMTLVAILLIRNWFGFFILILWSALLVALVFIPNNYSSPKSILLLFGLILFINGVRDIIQVARHAFRSKVHPDQMSDFHILHKETLISAKFWFILFVLSELVFFGAVTWLSISGVIQLNAEPLVAFI